MDAQTQDVLKSIVSALSSKFNAQTDANANAVIIGIIVFILEIES